MKTQVLANLLHCLRWGLLKLTELVESKKSISELPVREQKQVVVRIEAMLAMTLPSFLSPEKLFRVS